MTVWYPGVTLTGRVACRSDDGMQTITAFVGEGSEPLIPEGKASDTIRVPIQRVMSIDEASRTEMPSSSSLLAGDAETVE